MDSLLVKDHTYIFHPCSQMKDYETFKPIVIKKAEGSYIETMCGKKVIDAVSSWWCKSLGHQHPAITNAVHKQLQRFEHVIFANTTYDTIIELSERLCGLSSGLNKVMFASDGSCAVEIAIKMSLHTRKISGQHHKKKFISLKNSYHGETIGALSVSDLSQYRKAYQELLFSVEHLMPPYISSQYDPIWENAAHEWQKSEVFLERHKEQLTAVIVEPILQGACGMRVYSKDYLARLKKWTQENDVHFIADEILTAFGRTGERFGLDHAGMTADFVCLGKSLSAGALPISAVLMTQEVYDHFYADTHEERSFFHSHTHSGNALAAAAALAALNIFESEGFYQHIKALQPVLLQHFQQIQGLKNIRSIGAMVAGDLQTEKQVSRAGHQVFKKALTLGAYLRPLGDTIYWLPPLNIKTNTIEELAEITQKAINEVCFQA